MLTSHRSTVRLTLSAVLSAFTLAGCGSHPSRDESVPADTDLPRVRTLAGTSRLLPATPEGGSGLPTANDPPPVAGDDLAPAERCDSNYDPCVPIDSDVDCEAAGETVLRMSPGPCEWSRTTRTGWTATTTAWDARNNARQPGRGCLSRRVGDAGVRARAHRTAAQCRQSATYRSRMAA